MLASIGDTCPERQPDCGRLRAARNRYDSTVEQFENGELRIGHTRSGGNFTAITLLRPDRPPRPRRRGDPLKTAEPEHCADREAQSVTGPNPARRGELLLKRDVQRMRRFQAGAEWHLREVRYVRKYKWPDIPTCLVLWWWIAATRPADPTWRTISLAAPPAAARAPGHLAQAAGLCAPIGPSWRRKSRSSAHRRSVARGGI
jgi:hypothetical protein